MTTTAENNLVNAVKNYYAENKNSVRTKSRFKVVHEIHKELRWGTLKNSFLAKICHVFSLMTPKAAKIAKALRVYKFDSYINLSNKIKENYTYNLEGKNHKEKLKLKENVLKQLSEEFPQFSIEELEYIIESIDSCDSIILTEGNPDFATKNTLWKFISKNVHEKNQLERSSYSPPKKLTDEVILAEIEDYYKNDHSKSRPVHKSQSTYALNQIHKNLGLGNISIYKSTKDIVFEYFVPCTPQSSKYSVERISDALGVYKVNTFSALIEEIQNNGITKATNEYYKEKFIDSVIKTFPQFSADEVLYIINNLEDCKLIVDGLVKGDFSEKASAWKKITDHIDREKKVKIKIEKESHDIDFLNEFKMPVQQYSNTNNYILNFDALEATETSHAIFPLLSPGEICAAKVAHKFEEGYKLAICLSTDWSKPLMFNYENNYWNGNIPHNLEFKFVKVDSKNNIVAWETGKNRQLTQAESEIYLHSGELQF